MGDMGGHENGNGNGNGNGNAKGKGKEPMEPPLEGNNFRIPPPFPEPPKQCPRCFSTTTKFCYFNNRSASQPRYFCKSCKRYWTLGGALRSIPIGGSSRKGTKKMTKGDSSSGSLSSCSSFYVGEISRVHEHHSPLQHPQPPQPTTPSPLPAHMRAFSNDGLSFSSSFSLQGGIFSSFARLQNLSHSQGFNQVPLNGGGNIGGASGIQGARATNFSLFSGRPNLTGPPQIQQPVYQSNNRQQAMAHPNRPLGSLAGGLINHPSGSNINATLAGNNNVPGSDSAMNYQYQWCDEFYVDDVEDLFSGSSPPPPPS